MLRDRIARSAVRRTDPPQASSVHWFCPSCWLEVHDRTLVCPRCGADLAAADRAPFVDKLFRALSHPDAETVLRAIDALGTPERAEAVPTLAAMARGGPFPQAAEHAVQALARIGSPEAWRAVADATHHPAFFVRAAAATALGRGPADLAHEALTPLERDPSPTVREIVAAALARAEAERRA